MFSGEEKIIFWEKKTLFIWNNFLWKYPSEFILTNSFLILIRNFSAYVLVFNKIPYNTFNVGQEEKQDLVQLINARWT